MANRGRPSKYTAEIADEICEKISEGVPLAEICRGENMPSRQTVRNWMEADKNFSCRIACAREDGEDVIAAQCLNIADDERHDWAMSQKGEITNEVAIARARLRVDTRLKLLAKWNPKKYGDKIEVDATVQGEIKVTIGGDA